MFPFGKSTRPPMRSPISWIVATVVFFIVFIGTQAIMIELSFEPIRYGALAATAYAIARVYLTVWLSSTLGRLAGREYFHKKIPDEPKWYDMEPDIVLEDQPPAIKTVYQSDTRMDFEKRHPDGMKWLSPILSILALAACAFLLIEIFNLKQANNQLADQVDLLEYLPSRIIDLEDQIESQSSSYTGIDTRVLLLETDTQLLRQEFEGSFDAIVEKFRMVISDAYAHEERTEEIEKMLNLRATSPPRLQLFSE